MSLILVHLGDSAVSVVTDTAVLKTNGTVGNFSAKILPVPHANLVIATRGHIFALPIGAIHLQGAGATFDEIRANAGRALREFTLPAYDAYIEGCGFAPEVEFTLAGISETRGPFAYQVTIKSGRVNVEDTTGEDAMIGPFDDDDIVQEFEARIESQQSSRLAELGWLADRSRFIRSPVFGRGDAVSQIGGHAILATVTAGSIEQRVLRRWPDRIGERIEPGASSISAAA